MDHINILCRRVSFKLHALRRMRKCLTADKAKVLYNAVINSQFNHASITWMFCHKLDYLKIEKIQYKALESFHSSNESHEVLLLRSKEVTIHQKQRILVTEVFKSLTDIISYFMKSYFQ